mmetsp:Transcript_19771/g.66479  ORF Transcript_19771/g.66479 Transcript_19771/m.66479 type:complete len:200 (+) Transcript_19771:75-674(+)
MLSWIFGDRQKAKAAAKIQAVYRGRRERQDIKENLPHLRAEKGVRDGAASRINAHVRGTKTRAAVGALREERQLTEARSRTGVLEKRLASKSFALGGRTVVIWQRRYVRIDDYHFCYSSRPYKPAWALSRGSGAPSDEKRLSVLDVRDILTVEGTNEFILVSPSARLHFHCATAIDMQSWISTITLLQEHRRGEARGGA